MLLLLGCRARAGVAGSVWGAGLQLSLHFQGKLLERLLLLPRAHSREGSLILREASAVVSLGRTRAPSTPSQEEFNGDKNNQQKTNKPNNPQLWTVGQFWTV